MATHNPAEDVVAFLNGKVVGGVTLASAPSAAHNLYACEPRLDKDRFAQVAVFAWEPGGAPPMPYMGVASTLHYPRVQLRIRGLPGQMQVARNMARDVRDHLRRARTLPGYVSLLMNESSPIHLGEGASGGFEFGLNADLIYSET